MTRFTITMDEALEFFHYNILGSYNGEGMPSFLNDHVEPLEFFEHNILGSYNGEGMPAYLNDHAEP